VNSGSERSTLLIARRPDRRGKIAAALAGGGLSVVAEIADPAGALSLVEQREPAVLVVELDSRTDDPRALELVRSAPPRSPRMLVIAVTESLDPGVVTNALANGVDACVLGPDAS
jgi:DNA-binding NarL/FixJ family response regulator